MSRFVAYYRVSTDRPGPPDLGLDAQRAAVAHFVAGQGELAAEFTEVQSGKRNEQLQLAAALESCRRQEATLVIAKLDRLARNVAFIVQLMQSGVEFVALDNSPATKPLLHMLAAFAEQERDQISSRTKAALAAAKARGVRLGNPNPAPAAALGRAVLAIEAAPARERALPMIRHLRAEGMSLRRIALALATEGVPPLRGRVWHPETVRKLLTDA